MKSFVNDLMSRDIDPAQIDVVSCDMWDPYLNGIGKHLAEATVVFDRFHVMNLFNNALEAVQRDEQRENRILKKSRFLWLNNPKNLTGNQEARLEALKRLDLRTARAYQIKLALSRFWEIRNPLKAVAYLKRCFFWATHSRLWPVIRAARTVKCYWKGVINLLDARVTNGTEEGLSSKIETAVKRAYGFKQVVYLRTIFFHKEELARQLSDLARSITPKVMEEHEQNIQEPNPGIAQQMLKYDVQLIFESSSES